MRVNISIPYWGNFELFKLTVESVLSQSSAAWSLNVVDDNYPDLRAWQYISSLAKTDDRITAKRNSTNQGPSKNYNKLKSAHSTDYLVILGCDDVLLPDFVEHILELIEHYPDADIIQPGVRVIDEDGNIHKPLSDRVKKWIEPHGSKPVLLGGDDLLSSLLWGNWTYFPSLVWKQSTLKSHTFRNDLNVVQDLAMLAELIAEGSFLLLDDQVIFEYRRHKTSLSARTGLDGSKFLQEHQLFKEIKATCNDLGWTKSRNLAAMHFTSRANALIELFGAITRKDTEATRVLSRFVFLP